MKKTNSTDQRSLNMSGLQRAFNEIDVASNQFSLTSSQAQIAADFFREHPNVIQNNEDLNDSANDETFDDIPFVFNNTRKFDRINNKMRVQMKGKGKISRDALDVQINTIKQFFEKYTHQYKPQPPLQSTQKFPLYNSVLLYNKDQIDEVNPTLLRALVELSLQGCKQCQGFGHSYLKCKTYNLVRQYGNNNRFIKQGFKWALENIKQASDDEWKFEIEIQSYCTGSLAQNQKGTQAALLVELFQDELKQYVAALKQYKCDSCGGYGHISSSQLSKKKQQELLASSKKKQIVQHDVCPTRVKFEKRIASNPVAQKQFEDKYKPPSKTTGFFTIEESKNNQVDDDDEGPILEEGHLDKDVEIYQLSSLDSLPQNSNGNEIKQILTTLMNSKGLSRVTGNYDAMLFSTNESEITKEDKEMFTRVLNNAKDAFAHDSGVEPYLFALFVQSKGVTTKQVQKLKSVLTKLNNDIATEINKFNTHQSPQQLSLIVQMYIVHQMLHQMTINTKKKDKPTVGDWQIVEHSEAMSDN